MLAAAAAASFKAYEAPPQQQSDNATKAEATLRCFQRDFHVLLVSAGLSMGYKGNIGLKGL